MGSSCWVVSVIHRPKGSRFAGRQDVCASSTCASGRASRDNKYEAFELWPRGLPLALVLVFDTHHVLDEPYLARDGGILIPAGFWPSPG
jgi:hypothetical protein